MTYKKCACCGKATLETGSMHDICSFCGWEDDNVQNNNPDYWGGANLITLNEARQVVADGKDLRAYIRSAKQRRREEWLKAEAEED